MNIIKTKNDHTWLISDDTELKKLLYEGMRHRTKDYFHNRAYKQKLWDGYVNFFDIKTGKFLTGLLPEIEWALQRLNKKYNIIDERTQFDFNVKSIDENYIDGITLYDYQVDLINQILTYKRGIVTAPTASGKTNVLIGLVKSLPPKTPILVLQNRKSLAKQNYEALVEAGIENVGTLWDKSKNPNYITSSTIQSAIKLEKIFDKIKAIFVDEIHENMNTRAKKIYRKLKHTPIRVAISATPFKFGGKDKVQKFYTKGYFGPIMRTSVTESGILTTKYLQEQGRLSKSKCIFYTIDQPALPYETYQDAVKLGIEQSFYFHQIVKNLAKSLKGRTLILVERIEQGNALKSIIPDAFWIQGKDEDKVRTEVFEALKTQKNAIAIVSQGIITAGINVFVHNLINAAGGNAEHSIVQRMGRGLRNANDKECLNYYDFMFYINDYLYNHSCNRVKTLTSEGHEIEMKDEIDF